MGQPQEAEVLTEVVLPDAPETEERPSKDELIEQGMDPREAEMAQRNGLTSDKPEGGVRTRKTVKREAARPSREPDQDPEPKKDPEKPAAAKPEPKNDGEPDDVFARMPELFEDMTPEEITKERERVKKYSPTETGLYVELKRVRKRAQDSEGDRDYYELKMKKLEDEIEALKKGKPAEPAKPPKKDGDILNLLDEEDPDKKDGEEVDPKKKPLTLEDLDRIEKEKKEKADAARKIQEEHSEALDRTEAFAKKKYPDFDKTSALATEVLEKAQTLFKDNPRMIQKVGLLYAQYYQLASAAHKIKLDPNELNAADIIVEIGELHPSYKKPDGAGKPNADADGDRNPEKVNKMLENAKKRSSAALNGGNSTRVVSVDDLTVEQIVALPREQFRRLPRHVRDKALGRPSRS